MLQFQRIVGELLLKRINVLNYIFKLFANKMIFLIMFIICIRNCSYSILRFHKLVWGGANASEDWSSGIIAGGCDNGIIRLYNASKLSRNVDSIVAKSDRHIGSVKALNFNLFQVFHMFIIY